MGVIATSHLEPPKIRVARPDSAGDILEELLGWVYWGAVITCLIAFTVGAIMLGAEFLGRRDKTRSARWMLLTGAGGALLIGLGIPMINAFISDAEDVSDTYRPGSATSLLVEDSRIAGIPGVPGQYRYLVADASGEHWLGPTWTEPTNAITVEQFGCNRSVPTCRWVDLSEIAVTNSGWVWTVVDAEVSTSTEGVLLGARTWPVCEEGADSCVWREPSFDSPHVDQALVFEYGCKTVAGAGSRPVPVERCRLYEAGSSNTDLPAKPGFDALDYGAYTWLNCGGIHGCAWSSPQAGEPPSDGLRPHVYACPRLSGGMIGTCGWQPAWIGNFYVPPAVQT